MGSALKPYVEKGGRQGFTKKGSNQSRVISGSLGDMVVTIPIKREMQTKGRSSPPNNFQRQKRQLARDEGKISTFKEDQTCFSHAPAMLWATGLENGKKRGGGVSDQARAPSKILEGRYWQ